MKQSKIRVLGIGEEGAVVAADFIGTYAFYEAAYIDFSAQDNFEEYHLPFPGTKHYIYGEKHAIYEVADMDSDQLQIYLQRLSDDAVIVLNLAEPIAQAVLDIVMPMDVTLFVRFPFKFENTGSYQASCSYLAQLKSRKNTQIIDSELFGSQTKTLSFQSTIFQLRCGLMTLLGTAFNLVPLAPETNYLPLNYLLRGRVNIIFDPAHLTFQAAELNQRIDQYLIALQADNFELLKINSYSRTPNSIHYINPESVLDTVAVLLLCNIYKQEIDNKASYYIRGEDSFEFPPLGGPEQTEKSPLGVKIINQAFVYLQDKIARENLGPCILDFFSRCKNQYLVHLKTLYFKEEFYKALNNTNITANHDTA